MKIKTKNINDKKIEYLISETIKFSADKLLTKRMQRSLLVIVEKENLQKYNITTSEQKVPTATCEWIDYWIRPREFKITIEDVDSLYQLVTAISHEMVHVKQFAKEELKERFLPEKYFVWKGEKFKIDTPYYERPWEHEASQLELNLSNDFVKYFVKKSDEQARKDT